MRRRHDPCQGQRDRHLNSVIEIGARGVEVIVKALTAIAQTGLDHLQIVAKRLLNGELLRLCGHEIFEGVHTVLARPGAIPRVRRRAVSVKDVILVIAKVDQQRLAELIADKPQRVHRAIRHHVPFRVAQIAPAGIVRKVGLNRTAGPLIKLPVSNHARFIARPIPTGLKGAQRVSELFV